MTKFEYEILSEMLSILDLRCHTFTLCKLLLVCNLIKFLHFKKKHSARLWKNICVFVRTF